MAWPIVKVASGGIPVTESLNGLGASVEVAANGYGTPVTVVAAGGLPVVGTGGGSGPVTDPIVQSINADGWSVTTTNNPPTMDPDGAGAKFVYVIRKGYDDAANVTTWLEKLTLTKRIRLPYPNQATLTPDQVALSDYVYADDVIIGVTNNSTVTSPKPIANWARYSKRVLGNTFPKELLEIVVAHRNAGENKEVAAVKATLTDGTTTITVSNFVQVVSGHSGDKFPVVVWRPATDIDISALADTTITQQGLCYPRAGVTASIADSSLNSGEREFSPRTYRKNVALAATIRHVYVSTAGNDTSGVGSTTYATAKATPCLTVLGAINKAITTWAEMDNVQITIGDDGGTPFAMASTAATRAQNGGECLITRDPLVAKANARVSFGAAAFRNRFPFLAFRDTSIVRTGTGQFNGEASPNLRILFENCDIDGGGQTSTILSSTAHDYHMGTVFTNMGNGSLNAAASTEHRLFRGISASNTPVEGWFVIGSAFVTPGLFAQTRTASGSIFGFNRVLGISTTTGAHDIANPGDVLGAAFLQNLYEFSSASQYFTLRISGDGATGNNEHVCIHNNTYAGAFQAGRWNVFYDEATTPRTSKLMSVVGNIAVAIYTKSDVFRGQNQAGADASTRTGNWPFMYGVGCRANFSQFQSNTPLGGSEAQEYPGLRAKIGTSQTVRQDPLFTSYQGTTVAAGPTYTAGAGGGDYSLQAGSPAIGMNDNGVIAFDLAGNARSATASSSGAYERLAA